MPASETALPASVPPTPPTSMSSRPSPSHSRLARTRSVSSGRHPPGARRDAAGDRLADDHRIRLQSVPRRHAARTRAQRVGLVDDEEGARAVARGTHSLVPPRVGQHDADVRHGGLDQHGRDLARLERGLERGDVVERHDRLSSPRAAPVRRCCPGARRPRPRHRGSRRPRRLCRDSSGRCTSTLPPARRLTGVAQHDADWHPSRRA